MTAPDLEYRWQLYQQWVRDDVDGAECGSKATLGSSVKNSLTRHVRSSVELGFKLLRDKAEAKAALEHAYTIAREHAKTRGHELPSGRCEQVAGALWRQYDAVGLDSYRRFFFFDRPIRRYAELPQDVVRPRVAIWPAPHCSGCSSDNDETNEVAILQFERVDLVLNARRGSDDRLTLDGVQGAYKYGDLVSVDDILHVPPAVALFEADTAYAKLVVQKAAQEVKFHDGPGVVHHGVKINIDRVSLAVALVALLGLWGRQRSAPWSDESSRSMRIWWPAVLGFLLGVGFDAVDSAHNVRRKARVRGNTGNAASDAEGSSIGEYAERGISTSGEGHGAPTVLRED